MCTTSPWRLRCGWPPGIPLGAFFWDGSKLELFEGTRGGSNVYDRQLGATGPTLPTILEPLNLAPRNLYCSGGCGIKIALSGFILLRTTLAVLRGELMRALHAGAGSEQRLGSNVGAGSRLLWSHFVLSTSV